jgi:hypothetical protein
MSRLTHGRRAAALAATVGAGLTFLVGVPAATAAGAAPDQVPSATVQSVTANSIAVRWTPPTDIADVSGYRVDYSADHGLSWHAGVEVDDPTATTATQAGLTEGSSYELRVVAVGPAGDATATLVDSATDLSLGDIENCAVLGTGQVRCWGYMSGPYIPQPIDIPGLSQSVSVSATPRGIVCALRVNGDVTCGDLEWTGAATVFAPVAGLPHNIVQMSYAQEFGCALTANGQVWCWGYNFHGELGIGDPSVRVVSSAVRVSSLGPVRSISGAFTDMCAVLRADGQLMCWGEDSTGQVGDGGGHDKFAPVAVAGMTDVEDVSIGLYDACATVQHAGEDSRVYCWGPSEWQQAPTTPQPIQNGTGYTSVGAHSYTSMPPCVVGPSGGRCIDIVSSDLTAVATDGYTDGCAQYRDGSIQCQSPYSTDWQANPYQLQASEVVTADPTAPSAPNDAQVSPAADGQAQLSWLAPLDGGAPLTGYVVERSTDGGATWVALSGTGLATSRQVTEPAIGRADLYRVRAQNTVGLSDPSANVIVTQGGTDAQKVIVQTPDGSPVTGGAVTWASADGSAQSAVPSALTADGVLTFPRVVAGAATISIDGGVLPNGTTVSGSWPVTLGTDAQTLQVPANPDIITRTVIVTLPNGVPVVGASVRGTTGFKADPCSTAAEFTYCGVTRTALTDGTGSATINGWATESAPAADVVYSDGVLAQRQSVALPNRTATVQLQYMPWLTVNADGSPVDVGQLSTLAFAVNDVQRSGAAQSRTTTKAQPVKITIDPPTGWSAKRCAHRSVMSGTTNRRGHLVLHPCASVSGLYRVVSHGAVTTRSVLLRVKGAAPMSPTSLTVRSPRPGVVTASWSHPVYGGGAKITTYRLTATAPNQRTHTALVTAGGRPWTAQSMTHRFTGLTPGHKWTVKVNAITRYGTGPGVKRAIAVA